MRPTCPPIKYLKAWNTPQSYPVHWYAKNSK